MPEHSFVISFSENTTAEGNRYASTLSETLRVADPSAVVDRIRERHDTQDFGATLAVIAGTAAATAIAKGIAGWLARNSGARIRITRPGGEVLLEATHLDSADVSRIAEAISGKVK